MMKTTDTQSQKRFEESLGSLFNKKTPSEKNYLFLTSSSDIGVIRNGGRNGARLAPQSFLSTFKKFSITEKTKNYCFLTFEVSDIKEEKNDFEKAQIKEADKILSILNEYPQSPLCHIGGGHDHIYPLLKALALKYKKMIVINIDAHADTRSDHIPHSGNPFRKFSNDFEGDFFIYQIGLNQFANSLTTLNPLEHGETKILWRNDLSTYSLDILFNEINGIVDQETVVIFSLDADVFCASEIPGVSAVNPTGISREKILEIWDLYEKLPFKHKPILGLYELNPLYDTLASLSMRTAGSFVFETL